MKVALDGGLVGRGMAILDDCDDGPSLDGDAMRAGGRPNVPNTGPVFCGLGEPVVVVTRDKVRTFSRCPVRHDGGDTMCVLTARGV